MAPRFVYVRDSFFRMIRKRILRLDGATGTELAKQGMPPGVCPEKWVTENPEALYAVQRAYADAAMANGENSEKEIKEKDILHSGNKSYDVHDTPQSEIAALNNALEVANRL